MITIFLVKKENMDEPVPLLHYCNKKGKQVAVVITDHAKYRFLERYNLLFPDKNITISTAITYINYYWNTSSKLENLNKQEMTGPVTVIK